ncbi:FAD binding domain-containing protein [Trichoderma harzianum]|uniref:FAD binding domain-containing protein n=1 Tax=Trichoderma harzianum TaxID=5544 RepID=A0A0F9XLP1_TRIHA|nr:FAD binding domain-containing protein [Trichoderma harzianum]
MSSAATVNASGKATLILRCADRPVCRVLPINAADVATILNIVRETGATFAVKSGGHNSYASGTNAENGITIDLSRLKDITVSDDRNSVTVGAGCRFGEIYDKLEAHGLGCVGGRISSVRISGLTMGGGISFFSSERGLACDNVISYELVLANGQILNVSEKSHPDLFWGMRGAGITLGIVTLFDAFNKFVQDASDFSTEAFMLATDAAKDGKSVYAVITSHSNPHSNTAAFDDIKSLTPLASTSQIRSLKNLCDEMDSQNEPGFRFRTSSLSRWTDIQHDQIIFDVADQFVDKVEKAAQAQGTFHRYQYLNYAARHQDVYGSYGEENRKRLLEIKAKYDPEDLMSTLRPGIIQLSGSQKA